MSEYYAVIRSTDHLAHYGVKGMKWGVRRYQKADGSLTAKGKALVLKSGSYLNPSKKDKHRGRAKNRENVANQYLAEWNNKMYKAFPQYDPVKNPLADYGANSTEKKIWNKYKDSYASAVLKDMKLKDTKKARESVKRIYNDTDPDFRYANPDKHSEEKYNAYAERKKKMQHPTREKIKKAIAKSGIKQDLKDAVKAAGLSVLMGPAAAGYISSKRAANEPAVKNKKKKRR